LSGKVWNQQGNFDFRRCSSLPRCWAKTQIQKKEKEQDLVSPPTHQKRIKQPEIERKNNGNISLCDESNIETLLSYWDTGRI
jgi:hypothetical protein